MDSNMPILWQNALMQYGTEIARKAWVWFAETRGSGMQYQADKFAAEVDHLVFSLAPMVQSANKAHNAADEVLDDLVSFILRRHANYRLGGNINPTYC
jgi:hypothetical protein